jgi:hypothetical protein
MASVQFTWSDMWLQWYAEQVNDEVKNEFLKQVELVGLVKRVSPKVQVEMLEFAPVEVKRLVADSIHKQYYEKIMWNVEEVEEEDEEVSSIEDSWKNVPRDSCLYEYGVLKGYIIEEVS